MRKAVELLPTRDCEAGYGPAVICEQAWENYSLFTGRWNILYIILQLIRGSGLTYEPEVTAIILRGLLKFGFGWDVVLPNLKLDPHKYQFFQKK